MTVSAVTNIEDAIRHAGEDWLIDWFSPRDKAIPYLRQRLEELAERARQRLGSDAPDLSEAALVALYSKQPLKVKAFFQVLGVTRTADLLLMAWRIMQGMELKKVQIDYQRQDHFRMSVILESPYGADDEVYESDAIQDFSVFRHIGTMEINGKPVFDGFYPLKIK